MPNAALKRRIDYLKNFGIKNETEVVMPGINGKMNELQAALGIVNLRHYEAERSRRSTIATIYRERFADIEGLRCFNLPPNVRGSEQYFVIRIARQSAPNLRDRVYEGLKTYNVFARRYFYPLCSDASCYRALPSAAAGKLAVARQAADEVLALPYYGDLGHDDVHRICDIIADLMGSQCRE